MQYRVAIGGRKQGQNRVSVSMVLFSVSFLMVIKQLNLELFQFLQV